MGAAAVPPAQRVQECFLRSLELARIACKRPDNLDALGDQFRRRLELSVEPILPRRSRLELLVEAVLLPVSAVLPPGNRLEDALDSLESLPDLRFHEASIPTGLDELDPPFAQDLKRL